MLRRGLVYLALFLATGLGAELLQIGQGTMINQYLPMEPVACFSYSQQLYLAGDIGLAGHVSSVAFQYNFASDYFLGSSADWKVFMGRTSLEQLDDWVPLDSLQLVFEGVLDPSCFQGGIPGQGWLTVELDTLFYYNGSGNLLIAVDENNPGFGSNSDDFYCTEAPELRGLVAVNQITNPDPGDPPPPGSEHLYQRAAYPNLRLEIIPYSLVPWHPQPEDEATSAAVDTDLQWHSNASAFDLWFGLDTGTLQLVGQDLTEPEWTPPQALEMLQGYRWQVIAWEEGTAYPGPVWSFSTAGEGIGPPQNLSAVYITDQVQLQWEAPAEGEPALYRVIRNGVFLAATQDTVYQDFEVSPGQIHYYHVLAQNQGGELSGPSNTVSIHIPDLIPNLILQQGFEASVPFSQNIAGWLNLDLDGSPTWQNWGQPSPIPGLGDPLAWLVHVPSQIQPPLADVSTHGGMAMAAAFSVQDPPNDDWLISPLMQLGAAPSLWFWARSHTGDYGLERLRVLISTTDADPASFTLINAGNWLSVPVEWTEYSFDLSAWQGQSARVAFNCVSWDALALYLDDIVITGEGGYVSAHEEIAAPMEFRVHPNPSRGEFWVQNGGKHVFDLSLYDSRGRRLYTARSLEVFNSAEHRLDLAAGIYLIRVDCGGQSQFRRVAVIK